MPSTNSTVSRCGWLREASAAARNGFATTVRLDLTAGVAADTVEKALVQLRAAGVTLVGDPVLQTG